MTLHVNSSYRGIGHDVLCNLSIYHIFIDFLRQLSLSPSPVTQYAHDDDVVSFVSHFNTSQLRHRTVFVVGCDEKQRTSPLCNVSL